MNDRLNCVMRKISEECSKEEAPLCLTLHVTVHHLEHLRQQLEKVESAAQALDQFLATVREVKVEISMLPAKRNPSRKQNEAEWEQEGNSRQAAVKQKLHLAAEQSHKVDSLLKAVDVTLIMYRSDMPGCGDIIVPASWRHGERVDESQREREKSPSNEKRANPESRGDIQDNDWG